MTQKRPVTTKALSAYLKQRHVSFSAALHMLGLSQKQLNDAKVSDDTLGRIARLYGMEPEQLAQAAAAFEPPMPVIPATKPTVAPEPAKATEPEPAKP